MRSWPVASILPAPQAPEFNRVAIAVLSVANSLAGLEQRTHCTIRFGIRDGISEVKISSVFTCACSAVSYYFGA